MSCCALPVTTVATHTDTSLQYLAPYLLPFQAMGGDFPIEAHPVFMKESCTVLQGALNPPAAPPTCQVIVTMGTYH